MAKKGFISESLYNDLSLRIVRQQNKLRQIKASSKYKEGLKKAKDKKQIKHYHTEAYERNIRNNKAILKSNTVKRGFKGEPENIWKISF